MKVEVTQEDIDKAILEVGGNATRATCCPVTQALKRKSIPGEVHTCSTYVSIRGGFAFYRLPRKAQDFIDKFDKAHPIFDAPPVGETPGPITFEMRRVEAKDL
ncbi:hypothetical protein SEA_JONJAMES_154 [Gordonia Phage JonJames]|nr:hypothetical protein SEA_JONJAMES_154 [Gordonia Phage JonJames]